MKTSTLFITATVLLSSAPPSTAAEAIAPASDARELLLLREVQSAREMIGGAVQNGAGERLGKLADLLVHQPSGEIAYVILALDAAKYAVPFRAFEHASQPGPRLVLALERAALERAPQLAANSTELFDDEKKSAEVLAFYEAALGRSFPRPGLLAAPSIVRATDVISRDVLNSGTLIGNVEDVVVHPRSGRAFVLLDEKVEHSEIDRKFLILFRQLSDVDGPELETPLTRVELARAETSGWTSWDSPSGFPIAWDEPGAVSPGE